MSNLFRDKNFETAILNVPKVFVPAKHANSFFGKFSVFMKKVVKQKLVRKTLLSHSLLKNPVQYSTVDLIYLLSSCFEV